VRNSAGTRARQKRAATAAAAKQRRQLIVAVGGLAVLAILLVIQGPKLLDAFGGSREPAPAALPVAPVASTPSEEVQGAGQALRFLKGAGDPFATRRLANNDPKAGSVASPDGVKDPFALKAAAPAPAAAPDPAAPPAPAAPMLPNRIVVGTPTPGAVAKRGWIVVLASIQTHAGRGYADRFASRVRNNGLSVSVLNSSTRKSLRSGYYVVYTGPFASLAAVQRSAAHVRAFGYRTAYVREILRY
jgi:SPOR domain